MSNDCKKISIIIPCYNVEKYLPKCLDSVINQTYKNIEIICVNDGSTDNTLDVLDNYKDRDDRFVIVNQNNSGVSVARNNAFKYVTGDYIMFIDGDDWIDETTCQKAINKVLLNDYDMVIWNYVREFPNNPLPKQIFGIEEIIYDKEEVKHKLLRRTIGLYREELSQPENADSIVTIWGKLYRSSIIINNHLQLVDLKEIGTSEDALFNLEVYKYVKTAVYIPDCLYHYRKDNEGSVTSSYKSKLFSQWNNLFSIIDNYIVSNNLDNEYKEVFDNRISLAIIGLGLNELHNPKGKIQTIKRIKEIISSKRYREAYKALTLKYFPIHWKVFFLFAKMNFATGLYVLLVIIKKMIGK